MNLDVGRRLSALTDFGSTQLRFIVSKQANQWPPRLLDDYHAARPRVLPALGV